MGRRLTPQNVFSRSANRGNANNVMNVNTSGNVNNTNAWYYVFASFLAAFVVYLVATGGWEKVKEIWDRTKYKDSGDE